MRADVSRCFDTHQINVVITAKCLLHLETVQPFEEIFFSVFTGKLIVISPGPCIFKIKEKGQISGGGLKVSEFLLLLLIYHTALLSSYAVHNAISTKYVSLLILQIRSHQ